VTDEEKREEKDKLAEILLKEDCSKLQSLFPPERCHIKNFITPSR
jgi:hypothetical protein